MKPSMQKYNAIDGNQSVIQAHLIPQNPEFTIITADTPQPTRQKFITRVYSILWAQLVVTSIFIGCCNQIQPLQTFMISGWGSTLVFPCIMLMCALSCMIYCQHDIVKTCPGSGIYLTLFTGASSYILGYVGVVTSSETLLLAGLSTLGIFSGLSLYAVQTKYDYTDKGGYLLALLLGLVICGLFIPFTNLPILSIMYSGAGSIIFSFYIVYDTQLIVGGNHRSIMFHIDDYVFASVSLYLDIINLFLMLLDLMNGRS